MLKKYKIGFDIWGLVLFLIIMIPNFIWFTVPAPKDILRAESVTMALDTIASICQVLMIIALCFFLNRKRKRLAFTPPVIAMIICCLLYFMSWGFYYIGITNALVVLGLTVPPCLAFLSFAIDRKNMIAAVPIIIFTVCHLIYGIVNYIV
ncbi:MAG: hypothetical protein LBN30_01380 [Oscillospiraceae bacterium]|nr:hypothetical protein [Oscillospiraceae bacterium]